MAVDTALPGNNGSSLATVNWSGVCVGGSMQSTGTSWPAILLLTVAVGGMYTNLAMCVSLKRQWGAMRTKFYPYLLSLAASDLINCMLVMPMAVIHTILGVFPGSSYLCQVWYAGDLWLTAALALHLCVLALDLCVNAGPGRHSCFFASPTHTCMVLKLGLVWTLSAVTAIGPLVWYYSSTQVMMCPTCLPMSLEFTVISSTLCFFVPLVLLFGAYLACVAMVLRRRGCYGNNEELTCLEDNCHGNCHQGNEKIEQLKKDVQNFTSLSADLNIIPSPAIQPKSDQGLKHLPLERSPSSGLRRTLSSLSRKLSSRKPPPQPDNTPSSPKLDRHPSLRYSIKRATPSSTRASQRRGCSPEPGSGEGCSVPLLLAASSSIAGDSPDFCRGEKLDDQTICDMLLSANSPDKASSPTGTSTKRWGSRRSRNSSKRSSKKGSLSTTPSSPTLDRHPSLRYSIKRPRASEEGGGSKKGFSRSPSARSQRSFFSRSPSQRSAVSRSPSQRSYSQHSPFNRSPQPLKSSPLLTDSSHMPKDTVFHFPEHSQPTNHCHQQSPEWSTHSTSLHSAEMSTHSEQGSVVSHHSSAQSDYGEPPTTLNPPGSSADKAMQNTDGSVKYAASPTAKDVNNVTVLVACTTAETQNISSAAPLHTESVNDVLHNGTQQPCVQLTSPTLVVQTATPIKTITEPFLDIYTHKNPKEINDIVTENDFVEAATTDMRLPPGASSKEDGTNTLVGQVHAVDETNVITNTEGTKDGGHRINNEIKVASLPQPEPVYKPQDLHLPASVARAHSIESLENNDVNVIPQGSPLSVLTAPPWKPCPTDLTQLVLMTKLLGVLSVCFAVTHLPNFVSIVAWAAACCQGNQCTFNSALYFAFQWLAYLCSFLNPLVFFAFHKQLLQRLRHC